MQDLQVKKDGNFREELMTKETQYKQAYRDEVKKYEALKKAVIDCYNHMTYRTTCKGDWIKKTNELNNKIKELIK